VRIGLFTNNYLPFCGGVTISVQTLRRGLEARGHEAWIFAPRFPGAPDPDPRVVRFPSIPAATYPEFALAVPWSPRIGRLVGRLDLDVFHAHHPFLLGPAARRLARRRQRALVFTYHTRYEKYAHYVPLTRPLVEAAALHLSTRFAASADAVIAPSTLVRDQLRARGVTAPIAVVPTGVDLARFRPASRDDARHTLGLPATAPVVLYVGRLDREKSVDRVLLAFDRIAGTLGGAHLWLVGQGKETEPLRRLAVGLGAGDRIHFAGVRAHDGLAAWYQAADLFLFASETETQGLVLAEAAACGLPAVAGIAPGCDEVVRDGETGILTKGDPAALAEAAIGLLLDAERRAAMGARARQVAVDGFDVTLQIARTLDVYAEAQAHAARRRG
jgi:glycosyltransferase involved in cell wall biosynthesis